MSLAASGLVAEIKKARLLVKPRPDDGEDVELANRQLFSRIVVGHDGAQENQCADDDMR